MKTLTEALAEIKTIMEQVSPNESSGWIMFADANGEKVVETGGGCQNCWHNILQNLTFNKLLASVGCDDYPSMPMEVREQIIAAAQASGIDIPEHALEAVRGVKRTLN